ncbi:unnamed protein product [Didymodactylos carnosus]|uniref:Uncharacterized protein n=1 Tax=Didymodactylos carnosus TaxID=1234261 RepID=A0A815I6D1_9BILA|nr:unnamed protein product [Didymodactylos carnosus]CAF1361801.1 unnamed protein product [Didymodactylos carnosus]CAF4089779.1 unnamed protein product [Didymodactylos carnosus]CAF4241037.1 unnamed protein product [Didymodactylos carnosus]
MDTTDLQTSEVPISTREVYESGDGSSSNVDIDGGNNTENEDSNEEEEEQVPNLYDSDSISEGEGESVTKQNVKNSKLLNNYYTCSSLNWKMQYPITNKAYADLSNLQRNTLKRKVRKFHTVRKLKYYLQANIPLQQTRYGAFMHVLHAVQLLLLNNPDTMNSIQSSTKALRFRLAQDGTWIGKYLNCIVSTLSWLDLGRESQKPSAMVPLAIFRISKENRTTLEKCIPPDFVEMFAPNQTIQLANTTYKIEFF